MKKGAWLVLVALIGLYAWLRVRSAREKAAAEAEVKAKIAAREAEGAKIRHAQDAEAFDLARTVRAFYPFARELDEATDSYETCAKTSGPACAESYKLALDRVVEGFKKHEAPSGPCAPEVQSVVADQIAAAIVVARDQKKAPPSVAWQAVHASYRPCSDRLFRIRFPKDTPPTAAGAATYLGVRDDPVQAQPVHEGLLTLNGTTIDDDALRGN